MKKNLITTAALLLLMAVQPSGAGAQQMNSPSGELSLNVECNGGIVVYALDYKGMPVILPSRLGLTGDEADLASGFTVAAVSRDTVDQSWTPVWGEYASVRDHYNEMALTLVQEGTGRQVLVRFRLFDDGLGFRYEVPEQDGVNYLTLRGELTEFNLSGDHTAYCIPGDYDTNEFAYSTARISGLEDEIERRLALKTYETKAEGGLSVQTPLMLRSDDGLYINIHEAALVHYAAMLLDVDDVNFRLKAHLVPDKNGVRGYLQAPFNSPWRTVIVSDDARDILASQLIYNLNEPCAIEDPSWVKPQKFVGVWWEMFTGAGATWAYSDYWKARPGVTDYSALKPNGRHAANTENVKRYIDFAAEHGIDAVLVEGWNEGWEDWASYRKDRHFLFTKPYPDFDIDAVSAYAAEKGVNMIMHHETASNAADYERQLEDAFQYMVDHGYHSVKTGYVGYIIPRSEYHSSQWMNDHYIHVVRTAAEYEIMVDSHEAVRPTGLMRTWPNWVAQESARGGEFESMGGNDPDHTCILPFTRLKGGPMDYTPGLFQTKLDYYEGGSKPGEQAGTTLARQLALYVTMPSPLQMACDLPENYERFMDAFQFIKDVALNWDYSWYLEAEPGDYITVARKARGADEWFVGAVTDENAREAVIPLSFLPSGSGQKYEATVYADGEDADWESNPQSYRIYTKKVKPSATLRIPLAPGGGAAVVIRPVEK